MPRRSCGNVLLALLACWPSAAAGAGGVALLGNRRALLRGELERPAPRGAGHDAAALGAGDAEGGLLGDGLAPVAGRGKVRVLMLISDTGGGHRTAAQALQAALEDLFPGRFDVAIVDLVTDDFAWPFNVLVSLYRYLSETPKLWELLYSASPRFNSLCQEYAYRTSKGRVLAAFEAYAPDIIVSLHPLTQEVPLRVLRDMGGGTRQVPFVTVVLDLATEHPQWFYPEVDLCFVPRDPVYQIAKKAGFRDVQLRQHGVPSRPDFWKIAKGAAELRAELGLLVDRQTVLVVGGGDGFGNLAAIVDAIAAKLGKDARGRAQVVAVCGTNSTLKEELTGKEYEGVAVRVEGFVDRMSDYMAAADVLVTKAGSQTITEAMIRGLPMVLSSALFGQEAPNVPFVVDGGFGTYSPEPATIASTVAQWLQQPAKLREMAQAARAAGTPQAAHQIARDIAQLQLGKRAPAAKI